MALARFFYIGIQGYHQSVALEATGEQAVLYGVTSGQLQPTGSCYRKLHEHFSEPGEKKNGVNMNRHLSLPAERCPESYW